MPVTPRAEASEQLVDRKQLRHRWLCMRFPFSPSTDTVFFLSVSRTLLFFVLCQSPSATATAAAADNTSFVGVPPCFS